MVSSPQGWLQQLLQPCPSARPGVASARRLRTRNAEGPHEGPRSCGDAWGCGGPCLDALRARGAAPLRVRFKSSSRVTKLSQHQTDGGKFQERESIVVEIFPVLGEAAAPVEPRNRAFDNPTLG